jgi:hypothetical protein
MSYKFLDASLQQTLDIFESIVVSSSSGPSGSSHAVPKFTKPIPMTPLRSGEISPQKGDSFSALHSLLPRSPSGSIKTNVDVEADVTKYVRKLQYDLSRKDQMMQIQSERILELEEELKKYNGLVALLADLESEIASLHEATNERGRSLEAEIADLGVDVDDRNRIIQGFRNLRLSQLTPNPSQLHPNVLDVL